MSAAIQADVCPDCRLPVAWHFADAAARGYLTCPCAECARRPANTEALDCFGTKGDVCDACARLDAHDRNFAPERRTIGRALELLLVGGEVACRFLGERAPGRARVVRTASREDFVEQYGPAGITRREEKAISAGEYYVVRRITGGPEGDVESARTRVVHRSAFQQQGGAS